jgi:hypothetical protein
MMMMMISWVNKNCTLIKVLFFFCLILFPPSPEYVLIMCQSYYFFLISFIFSFFSFSFIFFSFYLTAPPWYIFISCTSYLFYHITLGVLFIYYFFYIIFRFPLLLFFFFFFLLSVPGMYSFRGQRISSQHSGGFFFVVCCESTCVGWCGDVSYWNRFILLWSM